MKIWLLLIVGAAGCGSGTKAPADQPAVYVQPTPSDPMGPANLGCVGGHADPAAPTATTAVDVVVKDFEKSTPVMGATVEVYLSLAHVNAMMPDGSSGPTDASGTATLTVPPGSYRVIFRTSGAPNTIETIEFNRAYNDAQRFSVSQATKQEIPALVSVVPDDTLGVVAGSLRDCQEREMGGITFTATSSGGTFDSTAMTFYFVDIMGGAIDGGVATTTVPSVQQKYTSGDGVFAILNVPPGDVTLTGSGLLQTNGALTKLGTGVAPARAGSITIVQLEPLGM